MFETWLGVLKAEYRDRILDIDEEVADKCGALNGTYHLPVIYGLLAAVHRAFL